MKLQPCITEDPEHVRQIYTITKGWRARIQLNKPKSVIPIHRLEDGGFPVTITVVSTTLITDVGNYLIALITYNLD